MTGQQQEGSSTPAASPAKNTIVSALTFLGVLQLYNIVAYHQSFLELSESIKTLAAWWRHWLGELFSFIHLDLPPLERELLSLLFIFGSAANVAFYRKHGSFFLTRLFREAFVTSDFKFGELFDKDRPRGTMGGIALAGSSILILTMTALVVAALPEAARTYIKLGFVCSILFFVVLTTTSASGCLTILLHLVFLLPALPFLVMSFWLLATASYYRAIFRASRYLVLLLVADLAVRYFIDPVMPWIATIPKPPAA